MYHVVIVEDDPMISMLNRKFTEKDKRFQVVREFSNGKDALQWLLIHPADLVVLDVYMPVLTGLELLRQLRAHEVDIDVIMVTAANDTKTLDALLKLGVIDYLVKPFSYQRFQRALEVFCQHRAAVQSQKSVVQSDIDRLLVAPFSDSATPKGMQEKTLSLIRGSLREFGAAGGTSEAISASTGLSVVTVRRYMNYLTETNEVESRINYDTGGRPSMVYLWLGET